jgi:hypothetical protein
MATPYKIEVEIGPHKFSAEGREEVVKEQFRLFLAAVDKPRPQNPKDPRPISMPNPVRRSDGGFNFPKSDWDRVFRMDPYGFVFLRDMRHSKDPDDISKILLLVFGHCKIKREQTIRAPTLMYSLRGSGVPIERLDRAIGGYDHLFTTSGVKKGTRYGLTDGGLEAAAEIFTKLAEEDRQGRQGEGEE